MYIISAIIVGFFTGVALFLQHPKFGKTPKGKRLQQIKLSPNYSNGSFQNMTHTPNFADGVTMTTVLKEFIFDKKPHLKPPANIPSTKTDLHALKLDQNILVWFGHSSYYMQIDGKRFLVDPVFSGSVSPLPLGLKSFPGTDIYQPIDIPEIDTLLISHDHWDHLDYKTIKKLKPQIKQVVCGLGVGQHLEHWGYDPSIIIEKDWNESVKIGSGFDVHTQSARHFSGRGLQRNKALWLSFVLQTPNFNIFIGGDSGYDTHFAEIGKAFGPFDLAIIENGQYNYKWKNIHLMPDEFPDVTLQINAKRIFPVHSAKFALAAHPWDEPLEKASVSLQKNDIKAVTPIIGQVVLLDNEHQVFDKWWQKV